MEKFMMIGLVVCGILLFLTQLLNYYIHIGRNKKNIRNKIISIASSTKAIALFTSLYWIALVWMVSLKIEPLVLIILLFVCIQFTFAVYLTSNLYVFDDYLLVPWNPLQFEKINSLRVIKGRSRFKLIIEYQGRSFSMSLKEKDLNILYDAIKKKNNIKINKNGISN